MVRVHSLTYFEYKPFYDEVLDPSKTMNVMKRYIQFQNTLQDA